jgi:hypothetical protein
MRTIASDHTPTLDERRAEEERLNHAVEVHGLRAARCPFCNGIGCDRCGFDGALYYWKLQRRCGETCPLRFPTN